LEVEISQLRSNLQRSIADRDKVHSELEQVRGKVTVLERGVEDRERTITELRRAVEAQERRNKQLVEGLEGEVKQRAGTLKRGGNAVSVTADSSLDHTLAFSDLTESKPSTFNHSKSLLEARMDALEQKLTTLHRSQALF
jgi:predicted RNase H-like nuclease (RuvC/YqgF family)